jgi:hypothetical protein
MEGARRADRFMSLRFLRLTTVYPTFAAQFLAQQTDLAALTHVELQARFVAARYAECDYYARHLRRLGYEAENHFVSIEPLQRKWAQERRLPFEPADWLCETAVAQVREFRPQVLFLDDLYVMDRAFRDRLRAAAGPATRVIGWRAATTDDFTQFCDLDLMLTSIPSFARRFQQAGIDAEVVPHGFESDVLGDTPFAAERTVEFSFAGCIGPFHLERSRLIETLLARTPLQVWGDTGQAGWKDRLTRRLQRWGVRRSFNSRLRTLAADYPARVHAQVFGRSYYELLARSKVVLNTHISCSAQDASNMRLFEATGMGACLLTDRQPNLAEFFEPETEVATYGSVEECIEKVKHLLSHEQERQAIAAAGQRRTLRDHTYARRVERLVEILDRHFQRLAA